jgi:hypothetical protein
MKRVDYVSLRNSLISILNTANTTTATFDLSGGMSARVKEVGKRDPELEPLMINEYPYIFVKFDSKTSSHGEFGASKIADIDVINCKITAIVDSGLKDTVEDDLLYSIRNIESNISLNKKIGNYNTLGAMVMDSHITNIDFKTNFGGGDSPYNKSAELTLEIKLHTKDI